jgi:hypothetical protein
MFTDLMEAVHLFEAFSQNSAVSPSRIASFELRSSALISEPWQGMLVGGKSAHATCTERYIHFGSFRYMFWSSMREIMNSLAERANFTALRKPGCAHGISIGLIQHNAFPQARNCLGSLRVDGPARH